MSDLWNKQSEQSLARLMEILESVSPAVCQTESRQGWVGEESLFPQTDGSSGQSALGGR